MQYLVRDRDTAKRIWERHPGKASKSWKMPEMFDNVSKTVKDDLTVTIKKGDKLSL